jgi:hypothetical protein
MPVPGCHRVQTDVIIDVATEDSRYRVFRVLANGKRIPLDLRRGERWVLSNTPPEQGFYARIVAIPVEALSEPSASPDQSAKVPDTLHWAWLYRSDIFLLDPRSHIPIYFRLDRIDAQEGFMMTYTGGGQRGIHIQWILGVGLLVTSFLLYRQWRRLKKRASPRPAELKP